MNLDDFVPQLLKLKRGRKVIVTPQDAHHLAKRAYVSGTTVLARFRPFDQARDGMVEQLRLQLSIDYKSGHQLLSIHAEELASGLQEIYIKAVIAQAAFNSCTVCWRWIPLRSLRQAVW